jgi:predicted PhzF superfamily epimerase YddE/YHI9
MPTRHDYLTVDVFTDRAFAGNPLAVAEPARPAHLHALTAT